MLLQCVLSLALLAAQPFFELSEQELDGRLASLHQDETDFAARFTRVVEQSMGTPYANGPLGEGPSGKYDQDPLMDHRRVDCVTFIEQAVAMAAAPGYKPAHALLQKIRYKDARINYESRNHFMLADWLPNNPWCEDHSKILGVATAKLTRTISKRDYFELVKAPDLGKDTPDRGVTIAYVPLENARAAEKALPSPALIVFIGKKPDWLFALHTGLYLRGKDGEGRLVHASSKAGSVTSQPLAEYLESQRERYLGFTAHAIHSPAPKEAKAP